MQGSYWNSQGRRQGLSELTAQFSLFLCLMTKSFAHVAEFCLPSPFLQDNHQ